MLYDIGKKDLAEWVNRELNGYPDESEVPPYRILPSQVLANRVSPAWQISGHPIPIGHLPDEDRERLQKAKMTQSLAILEEFSKKGTGELRRPLPMEANGRLGKGLAKGIHIQQAWCEIGLTDVKGVLAQVRSRLLDFLLELRASIGDVATDASVKEKVLSIDTKGLFANAIFGPNTTILLGSHNVQSVRLEVPKGDLAELSRVLLGAGLPTSEIKKLESAVAEDNATIGAPAFEGKTGHWYSGLLGRAAKGGLGIGVDVVSSTIAKALTNFIGS